MLKVNEVFQPWTLDGPRQEDGAWVLRIAELPGFIVAEETQEALWDAWLPALVAFLESFPAAGEPVPEAKGNAGWSITPPLRRGPDPEPRIQRLGFVAEILTGESLQFC